jgi:hypothetical protein
MFPSLAIEGSNGHANRVGTDLKEHHRWMRGFPALVR